MKMIYIKLISGLKLFESVESCGLNLIFNKSSQYFNILIVSSNLWS